MKKHILILLLLFLTSCSINSSVNGIVRAKYIVGNKRVLEIKTTNYPYSIIRVNVKHSTYNNVGLNDTLK